MQYMILIYADPVLAERHLAGGGGKMMKEYFDLNTEMRAAGALVSGDALQGVNTATTVRIRDGNVETMDGPFAETKETLGGYYIIEAPDLDAALGWAKKIPSVHWGSVEVRPVVVFN